MLVSLFNSPNINQKFNIIFAYNYSKQYAEVFHSRLKTNLYEIPIKLPTINSLFSTINKLKIYLATKFLKAIVIVLCLQYFFLIYDILRLFFIFKKVKPDILQINNGGYPGAYSCIAAVFAAKLAKVKKTVFVINNIIVPYNSFFRYMEKPIDKFVKNNTTVFITGSNYAANKLRDLWDLPENKVINIPNTVMPRPIVDPKETVLRRLNITNNHIILGNIGLLIPRKGQRYLIEALAIVGKTFDNFENVILIIEGVGKEKEHLKKLVSDLKLEKNIIFLENEKNIFDIINILDIFILPSIEYEDFPNVILEAMILGKPVIGTRLAGIPEQIEDGINGFVVDTMDTKTLARAILTLLQNKDRRKEMGIKSLERFNGLFSYDSVINKYINLYEKISYCKKL